MSVLGDRRKNFLPFGMAIVSTVLCGWLGTAPALAQGCPSNGSKPMVCDVEVSAAARGERFQRISGERGLLLAAGQEVELVFEARDQYGREFPRERIRYGFEPDHSCHDLVTVEQKDREHFQVRAGARRGACDILLWVPGNLNLEWPLRVEVGGMRRDNLQRLQAERIAARLYRGILGRDPDAAGLRSAAEDIQRGRLEEVADSMLASEEFERNRARMQPRDFLESLYRGLLSREPDSAGLRTYLGDMERGRYRDVVRAILESEEFDGVLMEK